MKDLGDRALGHEARDQEPTNLLLQTLFLGSVPVTEKRRIPEHGFPRTRCAVTLSPPV